MPRAMIRSVAALALAALVVVVPATAGAASPKAEKLALVRKAAVLAITAGTDRDPVGLKLACEPRSPVIMRCRGSWRDARYAYAGRFIAVDEGDAWTALFAGTRTDRACARRSAGRARRTCRDGVAF